MTCYTATYHSPLGLIVIESDAEALTGLRFADEKANANVTKRYETASAIPVIAATIRWLDDYFSGKQTENATMDEQIDTRIVVRPKGTMFQQRVWQALLRIPYGETVSYGTIARMVGCKSAQAVGQAVGANPIALLIPCHRVIAANGNLGGYAYGDEIKKRLLEGEQLCKSIHLADEA